MADKDKLVEDLTNCVQSGNFAGVLRCLRENYATISKKLNAFGVRDLLKKTTKDRLLVSFVDSLEFGSRPVEESLVRLEKLMALQPGTLVISKSIEWGLGVVKRLDYFYKRITVDFRMKKSHQFSYAAAADMLKIIGPEHVLAIQYSDPDRFSKLLKDQPDEIVKLVLQSFGPLSIVRIEDIIVRSGFVKSANWKQFWEGARAKLRKDSRVYIPTSRNDNIELKATEENYGEGWLSALGRETDPKTILSSIREYVAKGRFKDANGQARATIEDRLSFAVTAARRVNDALYATLAITIKSLGLEKPTLAEMREYLWEKRRFIRALDTINQQEIKNLLLFLAIDEESRAKICAAIPDLSYAPIVEIVNLFADDPVSRKTIADYLRLPKSPAPLTTLFTGRYDVYKQNWPELPPCISILSHAIALGEGRQNGEMLKMQNIIRRLFADKAWLEKVFSWLNDNEKALIFERFQASIAWDPSTHHAIVMRMVHIAPELSQHVVKVEKKKEYSRITSRRSYALKKKEYLKLINEDMPENVRKIEEAKGYGDLSENAEYQYAKDEQRILMQKQTLMQADLEAVKADDFENVPTDEVAPGVAVRVDTNEGEKIYSILGEWDNNFELGIISAKTKLAQNMLGKKVGDQFELPGEGQVVFGKVIEILPLSEPVKDWMKIPAEIGVQV